MEMHKMLMQAYNTMIELDSKYNGIRRYVKKFDCYDDAEELIRHFLRCSILNEWSFFDFEAAFETVKTPLYNKLVEHGLIPFEEFLRSELDNVGSREMKELGDRWGLSTNYVYLGSEEIFEAIQKARYEKLRSTFIEYDVFSDLISLYEKIQENGNNNTLEENIKLFDSCIHAEHVNGNILFDEIGTDIDSIKEDVDLEIGD